MRILHVTDTHFGRTGDTDNDIAVFNKFIREVQKRFAVDVSLHTGDVLNRTAPASGYETYGAVRPNFLHVPGNHDHVEAMAGFFPELQEGFPYVQEKMGVQFIGLDSSSGEIGEDQGRKLRKILSCGKPSVILLHHQFLPIDDSWLNPYLLKDNEDFRSILTDYGKSVLAVFHGHFHVAHSASIGNVPVQGGPSASFQYDPHASFKSVKHEWGEVVILDLGKNSLRIVNTLRCPRYQPMPKFTPSA